MTLRVCKTCGKEKSLTDFPKNKPSRGGHLFSCKLCKAEFLRKYMRELKKNHYEKWIKQKRHESDRVLFGGNREKVLQRDGYMCVKCSMSYALHLKKYGRGLTVDHIDGMGCNTKKKNNDLSNLQTLCLPCHGRKDVYKRKWGKFKVKKEHNKIKAKKEY